MFNHFRLPGLLSGLLLAFFASTGTALAQSTNQNPPVRPVTVTLQVPTLANATSTTIQLHVRTDVHNQQTAIQVTSDANPSAPTILAASVGGDSVSTVPVDASDAFDWAVSPNPTRPGCGPHPPAGTPGCSHAPAPEDNSIEVASVQATKALESSASAAPVLQYTVQPGDTLTAVARRFYGDDDAGALDQLVQTNLGQPMPDGRTFADANQIQPGWLLTLPLPSPVAYDRDGQRWYVVQPGDTLSTIAARVLGNADRWPELYALNRDRIEAPSRIRVGAMLQLPVDEPVMASAEGQDDAPVQVDQSKEQDAPAPQPPQPQAAPVPPTSAASTSPTPTWAGPLQSTPKSTAAAAMTPAVTGESQEVHSPPDGYQVAATSASLAMLLSTALGLWLARPQPRPALLATVPDQQRCRRPSPDTDRRAQRRALALQAVLDGTLTNEDAAAQLEVSARQLRRLLAAYRNGGVEALRHANAGRVPAHAVPGGVRDQVVELVRTRYVGLSQSELAQRLATEHGIYLHRTTVRRILLAAGLAQRCSDRGQW